MVNIKITEIAGKVLSNNPIDRDDIEFLFSLNNSFWDLLYWANRIREKTSAIKSRFAR